MVNKNSTPGQFQKSQFSRIGPKSSGIDYALVSHLLAQNAKELRAPGIEPGATTWQAAILPTKPSSLIGPFDFTRLDTRALDHLATGAHIS
jgi:hypothetical protein